MSFSKSLATATTAAVAATALIIPSAAAQTVPAVESGTMDWKLKESFLSYIAKPFAKGEIHVKNGAKKVPAEGKTESFNLPVDAAKTTLDAQGNGTIALDGAIQFLAHPGLGENGGWGLDLTYNDLKVKVTGTKAEFIADYKLFGSLPGSGAPSKPTGDDVVIAEYELPQAVTPEENSTVKVTSKEGRLKQGGYDSLLAYSEDYKPEANPFTIELKFKAPKPPKTEENPGKENPGKENPGKENPKEGSSLSTGGLIGIVGAILALLGGIGAFVGPKLFPQFFR